MNKLKLKWILQILAVILIVLTVVNFFFTMKIRVDMEEEGLGRFLVVATYGLGLLPILMVGVVFLFPIQYLLGQKEKIIFRTVFHSLLLVECFVELSLVWAGMIGLYIQRDNRYIINFCDKVMVQYGRNMAVLTVGTLVLYAIANLAYFIVTLCRSDKIKHQQADG